MRFDNTVKDEKKTTFDPFPEGEYDFEVVSAVEKISRNGNEMIEVSLDVFNEIGQKRRVFDYLVVNQQWKIKAFCEGAGMLDRYDAGELHPEDMAGKTGRVRIGIQAASGDYPEKNTVNFYVRAKAPRRSIAQPAKREPATAGGGRTMQDLNDEIPFGPCWQ